MEKKIAPSILNANYYDIKNDITNLRESNIDMLHLDVMDGMFVNNISFGIPFIKSLRDNIDNMIFDTHLMIVNPERYIDSFIDAGSDIITVHFEATEDLELCIKIIRDKNKKVGISIKPDTDESKIYKFLEKIDMILVMSVYPGFGGQKFIEESYSKIRNIKNYIDKNNLNVDIEVDGGINANNIKSVKDAGANIFVVGSSIFKGDIKKNILDIKNNMGC